MRGREPGYIVVGAHYDTKDIDGFVGANDGASGTAVVTELARTVKRPQAHDPLRSLRRRGEPARHARRAVREEGLRGSKVAARRFRQARAMVLLDFVGDRRLASRARRPRTCACGPAAGGGAQSWRSRTFPDDTQGTIQDDHVPFLQRGVPSIDLIDFDFSCWHRLCDDLDVVSERSVDVTGETVLELIRGL